MGKARVDYAAMLPFCVTPEQRVIVEACEHCGGAESGAAYLGMNERTVKRSIARVRSYMENNGSPTSEPIQAGKVAKRKRYVITAAQNATPVHRPFLDSLQQYCQHHNAQLIVIPMRYRNPTRPNEETFDYWHDSVVPYLVGERQDIVAGLKLMADIKILPTAVKPLSDLHTITGSDCGIFGHTKMSMECVPTPGTKIPKLLYTTGAVTQRNYSDSKAGKKGEFHHVLGGIVVEVSGDKFHLRNINAQSDGTFIDWDKRYTPDGVVDAPRPAAFIMGDLHAVRADPDNLKACKEIIKELKPVRLVTHDALDFQSQSHHNNWFERFRLFHFGKSDVMEELRTTCAMLDELASLAKLHVVSSNHDEHLYKWLEKHDNALDIQNALIYHELKADMLRGIIDTGKVPDPLELMCGKLMKRKPVFIHGGSLQVHGIELGYHGDKGPNGARGNADGFDRIGVKTVIGHSHTPRIVGGVYQTGTASLLDMGYNKGPSSWMHSHVLVYGNGKRTHVHVIDGSHR